MMLFIFLLSALLRQVKAPPLAITHVSVIDTTGADASPDMTVVITGGRITAIGKSGKLTIPYRAKVVNATGKYLIPGLWDMHVHPNDKDFLSLFVSNGITGIRVMWGDPEHYLWRREIEFGKLIGPHMVIASPIVDGPKPYWPGSISVSTEAQARDFVRMSKRRGADFVKEYEFLPRDLYLAIADECKNQQMPFAGHVPLSVTAEEASNAGQLSMEHLIGILPACSSAEADLMKAQQDDLAEDLAAERPKFWGPRVRTLRQEMLDTYDTDKASALFSLFKANGTWQCPTLTLLHVFAYGNDPAIRKDPRLKYLAPSITGAWDPAKIDGTRTPDDFAYGRKEFQRDLQVVGAMQRSGVGILAGTDCSNPYCFPGFGLHDELGYLVKAGLTPMQALQAATLSPARFLHRERDYGSVAVGKVADLVLLDANPLANIGNTRKIRAVVLGGKLLARTQLDGMLAHSRALASRVPISTAMYEVMGNGGVDAAVKLYRRLKETRYASYVFGENELIVLGYRLLHAKRYSDAIAVFKLSVDEYPRSYNTYDSLAEAYMDSGDRDLAVANYRKSVKLNPSNANGSAMLRKLTGH